jgi:hypothetical protein
MQSRVFVPCIILCFLNSLIPLILCFLLPNNTGMELTVMQWWLGSLATASAPPSPPGPLADVTPVVDAVVSSDVQLRAHEAEDHSKNILCK